MQLNIVEPERYAAALYIRLSREDENEGPSQSVTNQRSLLEQFTRAQGLRVYDVYIDDGWSGTSFDRPAFQRMLRDIEAHRVNLVVTKDLSRLGRDYIMTGHYMERYFPEKQVRYLSLLDGIDTGVESSANDITPFRAIMNDMYAKDISKKIKSVKHDKQHKGQFIGGKPCYGYRMHPREKNKIVIDEAAANVVRLIFAMALAGESCRRIAARLNEEKIPTPAAYAGLTIPRRGAYSGLWSSERVTFLLKNETYIGSMVQGRSVKISYKSKKCLHREAKDWIVVENTHEPIIGREAFERVQQLIESRRHTRTRTYDFLLKGMIVCRECGYPLAVLNRKTAKGEDCLYFVCRTYQRFTDAGVCTCHSIQEQTVTKAVLESLRQTCQGFLQTDELISMAKQATAQLQAKVKLQGERAALCIRIANLTEQLDQMYMDKLKGLLPEEDFRRLSRRVKEERDALEKKAALSVERAFSPEQQDQLAKELVRQFSDRCFTSREVLCSLIERVELTQDKQVIIRCRFCE